MSISGSKYLSLTYSLTLSKHPMPHSFTLLSLSFLPAHMPFSPQTSNHQSFHCLLSKLPSPLYPSPHSSFKPPIQLPHNSIALLHMGEIRWRKMRRIGSIKPILRLSKLLKLPINSFIYPWSTTNPHLFSNLLPKLTVGRWSLTHISVKIKVNRLLQLPNPLSLYTFTDLFLYISS